MSQILIPSENLYEATSSKPLFDQGRGNIIELTREHFLDGLYLF